MDQSQSNNESSRTASAATIPMPRRTLSVEFFVGIFALITMAASAYLSVGLGDMALFGSDRYEIKARFDSVSGLKSGASVEIAGVQVGLVSHIELLDSEAVLTLAINSDVKIRDDDQALIRTKGIIGDRYVKISRGASEKILKPGERIHDTTSVVDIEDLIGKFMNNMGSEKEKE